MSIFKKLFGGGSSPAAKTEMHKDYRITPTPIAEGNSYRICALIEKEIDGDTRNHSRPEREKKLQRAGDLMKRVGIWDFRHKLPGKLSGGECQRAAVVRAMINAPSLLLADEPTGALDKENVDVMADLLLELNESDGLTLLLVTHSMDLAKRMGKILEFKNGRLEQV